MRTSAQSLLIVFLLTVTHAMYAETSETAHENAPKVTPRTTEEMQTPGYWISRLSGDPDRVIMTPARIQELNAETRNLTRKLETMRDIDGKPYTIDGVVRYNDVTGAQYAVVNPLEIAVFPGDSLRARLATHRRHFENNEFYDHRQMKFDDDKKAELHEKTDTGSIPDRIIPRYGIITNHTNCRVLPTDEIAYGKPGQWYVRGLQGASCDVAMPLAVLHASKNRDWYYVRTEVAFGWVRAADVALGSREEIAAYVDSRDFIVALDHAVPVFSDSRFDTFLTDLYLGSKMQLVNKTAAGYHVRAPFRAANGSMVIADGWVRPDAKVSVGYQPFTQRNMLNTLFNILYRPYSWNDAYHEWNCCGYIRAVLRTFGMKMGSWPAFQLHYSDNAIVFPAKTPREVKYRHLESCDPGICLVGSDGHILVYLGTVDGYRYVIHMGGYDYTGEDGTVMMYRRVNVNHTELEGGYNIDDWTKISPLIP